MVWTSGGASPYKTLLSTRSRVCAQATEEPPRELFHSSSNSIYTTEQSITSNKSAGQTLFWSFFYFISNFLKAGCLEQTPFLPFTSCQKIKQQTVQSGRDKRKLPCKASKPLNLARRKKRTVQYRWRTDPLLPPSSSTTPLLNYDGEESGPGRNQASTRTLKHMRARNRPLCPPPCPSPRSLRENTGGEERDPQRASTRRPETVV